MTTTLFNQNHLNFGDVDTWSMRAIKHAERLFLLGKQEWAKQLAQWALPGLKGDAGFRDQAEPLTNFEILPALSAAAGDERTQSLHVLTWIRLAKGYALVSRYEEANRLLDASAQLASRYILEPESSNTVLAMVEEAHADLAAMRSLWTAAVSQLRQSRTRLLNASANERSMEYGRRHVALDNPLLRVDAKLLWALTEGGNVIVERRSDEMKELAEIALEFSASRADLNINLTAKSLRPVDSHTRTLVEREGKLVDELVELRGQLAKQLAIPGPSTIGETLEVATSRLDNIYRELIQIKADIANHDDALKRGFVDFMEFQQRLGERSAFWQWISHPNANIALCWTNDGIRIAAMHASFDQIRKHVSRLQAGTSLRDIEAESQLRPFPKLDAAVLYDTLFGGLAQYASATNHWILATSQLVDGIPWSALIKKATKSMGQPSWLIERAALTVSPSWRTWLSLRKRQFEATSKELLVIGDPKNEQRIISLGSLHKKGVYVAKVLDRQTESFVVDTAFAQEISSIAALFPARKRTVLQGRRATKSELAKLSIGAYRIVVFSTHGYMENPLALTIGPSLELTASSGRTADRFLTVSEIARYSLNADVVVLSACDTSAADGYLDSEGFSGLTSAFLLAGARSVIATLWPVETNTTKFLMKRTLRYYIKRTDPELAFALRHAMLDFLRSNNARRRHPAYWSAFLLVGK